MKPQDSSRPGQGPEEDAGSAEEADQTASLRELEEAQAGPDGDETPLQSGGTPATSTGATPRATSGSTPIFSPNEVVAGRYRIVKFRARGGMGEVYEAEDLELREPLALKTIRPEVAEDQQILDRFRQEIYLARQVTHPNVCRIFDLFHHERPALGNEASSSRVSFLTMELLQGETLSERLRRTGPIPTAEAVPILLQVCAALDAAHRAGIVHCDLKSSNVVLVPIDEDPGRKARHKIGSSDSTDPALRSAGTRLSSSASSGPARGVRAVITDFGLASGGSAGVLPSSGRGKALAGSPAYMAPEQVSGDPISPATDLYSLGVVMYEMATGRKPFVGETPYKTATLRLKEPPVPPRQLAPAIDPLWEAVILRCLEREPARRFPSATEVAGALRAQRSSTHRQRGRRRALLSIGAAAALLAVLGAAAVFLRTDPSRTDPPRPAGRVDRPSVAVLGFKNLAGRQEAAWLSTALSEMLNTELAAGEKLRTIPGENVSRMKLELDYAESDTLAPDTLSRIRQSLGADYVVLGSYLVLGEPAGRKIRLDLRLQQAESGETLAAVAETGSEEDLFGMVSRVGGQLRQKLEVGELSAVQAAGVQASRPSSSAALQLYSEGLQRLRHFDPLGARDLLQKAVEADPAYPLAHAALAEAWLRLGYEKAAREAGKKAVELSGKLSREERLSVEGSYCAAAREWGRAAEIYGVLWGFFPDSLDYGLQLAAAQTATGHGTESLATVEALRRLSAPSRDDPRIDLAEGRAAAATSDFERQRQAAARAAQKGQMLGTRRLLGEARLLEYSALMRLGRPAEAMEACREAERIFSVAGDRWALGRAQAGIGNLLADQGALDGAKAMYERWLSSCRELGNRECEAGALNNLASLLTDQGKLAGARKMFEESLVMKREVGDPGGIVRALSNIARISRKQGDLEMAERLYKEALVLCNSIGNKNSAAAALLGLGTVGWLHGDLAEARKLYQESEAIARGIGNRGLLAELRFGLGEVLLAEGRMQEARKSQEEALAIREDLGEMGSTAESRIALAALDLIEGLAAEAEKQAAAAAETFRKARQQDQVLLAEGVRARAILAQGRVAEAVQEMERIGELAEQSEDLAVRLTVKIIRGRIRAAVAKDVEPALGQAIEGLRAAVEEADKADFRSIALTARLALGEVELAAPGRELQGRARLEALQREATERGFKVIADRAAEVLR